MRLKGRAASSPTTCFGWTKAMSFGSASSSLCSLTTASRTSGCAQSACSISPSSILWPRNLICESIRLKELQSYISEEACEDCSKSDWCVLAYPPNSSSPSAHQRTRSPVRYKTVWPNGSLFIHRFTMNRSAVSSGRFRYPRATCTPPKQSSP